MTWQGADVEQLRQAASQIARDRDHLRDVVQHLNQMLANTPWAGPAAQRFRQQWGASLAPRLRAASAMLDEMAAGLLRNADEQEHASAAVTGAGNTNVATGPRTSAGGESGTQPVPGVPSTGKGPSSSNDNPSLWDQLYESLSRNVRGAINEFSPKRIGEKIDGTLQTAKSFWNTIVVPIGGYLNDLLHL